MSDDRARGQVDRPGKSVENWPVRSTDASSCEAAPRWLRAAAAGALAGQEKPGLDPRTVLNYHPQMHYRRLGKTGLMLGDEPRRPLAESGRIVHGAAPRRTPGGRGQASDRGRHSVRLRISPVTASHSSGCFPSCGRRLPRWLRCRPDCKQSRYRSGRHGDGSSPVSPAYLAVETRCPAAICRPSQVHRACVPRSLGPIRSSARRPARAPSPQGVGKMLHLIVATRSVGQPWGGAACPRRRSRPFPRVP